MSSNATAPAPVVAAVSPLDKGYIVAVWLESLFYGVYVVLCGACIYILVRRRESGRERLNVVVIAGLVAMFCLSTMHTSVGLTRLIQGFTLANVSPPGTLAVFVGDLKWMNVFKETIYTLNTMVADSLLIWRVFSVWRRDWRIIIVPCIFLLGTGACGFASTIEFGMTPPVDNLAAVLFLKQLENWVTGFFVMTLCTNFYSTSAIAYRIITLSRGTVAAVGEKRAYWPLIAIVIESGLLYSATMLTLLILWVSGNSGEYLAVDATANIANIVPTLIVLRVGLGWETRSGRSNATDADFGFTRRTGTGTVARTVTGGGGYAMKALAVNITTHTQHDGEAGDADADSATYDKVDGKHFSAV